MKLAEMRTKTSGELVKQADKDRKKISSLYTDIYTKEVKNTREIRLLKKQLARLLTIIREKVRS